MSPPCEPFGAGGGGAAGGSVEDDRRQWADKLLQLLAGPQLAATGSKPLGVEDSQLSWTGWGRENSPPSTAFKTESDFLYSLIDGGQENLLFNKL